MAASSSGSRRYDVFSSFSGEDVRKTFLSHLLKALDGRSIKTFIDHGIERSRPIAPELLSAIRESSISIVIFSKNYAPCCIENISWLRVLTMRGCQRLRNICPNIFRLTDLKKLDFTDCGGVVTALSDTPVMGTMEITFLVDQ